MTWSYLELHTTGLEFISREFINILAPARCLGCLRENTWLCPSCIRSIKQTKLSCIVCGHVNPAGLTCLQCRQNCPLTGIINVSPYGSRLIRRGIHWLKFKGVKEIAHPLALLLIPRLMVIAPFPQLQQRAALVPVPLHRRRLSERGFNQSLALAQVVSTYTGIPVLDIASRHRLTHTQAKLPREFREQNVSTAFTIQTKLPSDRHLYIVIDDVTTSGATLSAIAKVLLAAGTKNVWGATIARG